MEEWIAVNEKDDWKRGTDKKGLTVDGRQSSRDLSMMRCSTLMPFLPEDIFLTLCDGTLRQEYDPNIEITKNLEKLAANTYATYQKAKRIALVISPRDFVIITYFHKHENGDIRIIAFSEDSLAHLLPESKDIVRGELHLAGWHLEKTGEKESRVTLIQELDFKGSIPKSAISSTNNMQAE